MEQRPNVIRDVIRLIGVYDADGSLVGELTYVALHLLGRADCSLCDITHGPLRRKRAFDRLRDDLGIPFELRHRDELTPDVATFVTGRHPCVVAETAAGFEMTMTADELRRCGGDVDAFGSALRAALDGRGRSSVRV